MFGWIGIVDTFDGEFNTFPIIVARNEYRNIFCRFQLSFLSPIDEKKDKYEDKADDITIKRIPNEYHREKTRIKLFESYIKISYH
jgi:hypothetical protein